MSYLNSNPAKTALLQGGRGAEMDLTVTAGDQRREQEQGEEG